jgi:hypothetical protein
MIASNEPIAYDDKDAVGRLSVPKLNPATARRRIRWTAVIMAVNAWLIGIYFSWLSSWFRSIS